MHYNFKESLIYRVPVMYLNVKKYIIYEFVCLEIYSFPDYVHQNDYIPCNSAQFLADYSFEKSWENKRLLFALHTEQMSTMRFCTS